MTRPVHFPLLRISSQLLGGDQNLDNIDNNGDIEKIMLINNDNSSAVIKPFDNNHDVIEIMLVI